MATDYASVLDGIRRFYASIGPRYELLYPGYAHVQEQLARSLVTELERFGSCAKIADVACGCGWLLEQLAEMRPALELHGFDASPEEVDLAEKRALGSGSRVSYHVTDWLSLSEATAERFDAVFCLGNSFSHLPLRWQEAALYQFGRILRSGGVLVIDTYARWNERFGSGIVFEPKGMSVANEERVFSCIVSDYCDCSVTRHVCFAFYRLGDDPALGPTRHECHRVQQYLVDLSAGSSELSPIPRLALRDATAQYEYYAFQRG